MTKFLNFKNISVLMLLLTIFILSLTTVFATDHGVSGNSFTDIQTAINSSGNNDRILLGSDTYTGSGNPLHLDGDKNITIQGQSNSNRATLDAKNLSGFLYIESGSSATIRYVNFINMDYGNHGLGAYGTVIVENCDFSNSNGDSGTAIYINGTADNSIIRNCNFINNNADNHGANDYTAGGAICIDRANNVKIINSNFKNNRALDNGGALMIRHDATGIQITNCTFTNNTVLQGGAIAIIDGSSATIQDCTFTNNKATSNGGAIYSTSSSLKIANSTFSSNSAVNGGGIYLSGSSRSTISGSSIFNSNSAKYGGAIYSNSPLAISSTKLSTNKATSNGGAIYSTNLLNLSNCIVKSNIATYGSGIYSSAFLRITKTTFNNNIADIKKINIINDNSSLGDKLNVIVTVLGGDNVIGAIYSKYSNILIDNESPFISDKLTGKSVTINVGGINYLVTLNSKGIGTLKLSNSSLKSLSSVNILASISDSKKMF